MVSLVSRISAGNIFPVPRPLLRQSVLNMWSSTVNSIVASIHPQFGPSLQRRAWNSSNLPAGIAVVGMCLARLRSIFSSACDVSSVHSVSSIIGGSGVWASISTVTHSGGVVWSSHETVFHLSSSIQHSYIKTYRHPHEHQNCLVCAVYFTLVFF